MNIQPSDSYFQNIQKKMFSALKDYNITMRKQSKLGLDNTDLLDSLILSLSDEEDALEMIACVTRNDNNMPGTTGDDMEGKNEPAEAGNIDNGSDEDSDDEGKNDAPNYPLVAANLGKLDKKFESLTSSIKSFRDSLKFSQGDDLKKQESGPQKKDYSIGAGGKKE